jgi:putative SOS response-associated peptidase YedK
MRPHHSPSCSPFIAALQARVTLVIHVTDVLYPTSTGADGVAVQSCTIVTMPANKLMAEIHNVKHRMPAILAKEDRDARLTGTPEEAFSVIKQYPDTHMVATPVSTRVNTPKNNDSKLIEVV